MESAFDIGGRQLVVAAPLSRSVFKVRDVHTGVHYALKIYRQPDSALLKQLRKEVTHLREINPHPHIVTLQASKDSSKAVFLLYDLCESKCHAEGSFAQWRPTVSGMDDTEILKVLYQVSLAVCHMHRRAGAIVHRNLTPKSVLISQDDSVKLSRFTSSAVASSQPLSDLEVAMLNAELQLTVNKSWKPPELVEITHASNPSCKQDIWNIGEFVYFLLFARKPFEDRRAQLAGSYVLHREISQKLREVLRMTLEVNPAMRADITDVMAKILEQPAAIAQCPTRCFNFCLPARNTNTARSVSFKPKKSTAKCLSKLLRDTQEPPKEKHLQKLVEKAWAKPVKIKKFFKELLSVKGAEWPQVRLKALIVLHEYIRQAPLLAVQAVPGPTAVLAHMENNCPIHSRDPLHSDYFRQLTEIYCQALRAKVTIHTSYLALFDGKFQLKQDMGHHDFQSSGPLTLPLIQDLMSCLKRVLRAMEIVGQTGVPLPAIREAIVKTLANEVTGLINPLIQLLSSWKRIQGTDCQLLIAEFQETYVQAQALFQRSKDPRLSSRPPDFLTQHSSRSSRSSMHSVASQEQVYVSLAQPQPSRHSTNGEFKTARANPEETNSRGQYDLIDLSAEKVTEYAEYVNKQLQNWQVPIEEVTLVRQIGSGASSEVWMGTYRKTRVAVKKLRTDKLESGAVKEFGREVAALVQLRHPNLVLFMGAYLGTPLCVVTEYCAGGDLFHLLHKQKDVFLSWEQKVKMCLDIAKGMHYLHSCRPAIIHRDLKSLNLLVDNPVKRPGDLVHVKISDFGLAKAFREKDLMTGQLGTCVFSTQHWMAPEVLLSQHYTLKADVYSFAVRYK